MLYDYVKFWYSIVPNKRFYGQYLIALKNNRCEVSHIGYECDDKMQTRLKMHKMDVEICKTTNFEANFAFETLHLYKWTEKCLWKQNNAQKCTLRHR